MNNLLILEKYRKISEEGRVAYSAGVVKPFIGFPDSAKKRLDISVGFDSASTRIIKERVLRPLSDNSLGISSMQAVRDFPLHTTILGGENIVEISNRPEWLSLLTTRVSKILVGREICFDRLIADTKGTVMLAATNISEYILSARAFVTEAYIREGIKVIPLDNILHSAQIRVRSFSLGQMAPWAAISSLDSTIRYSPIKVCISEVYSGPLYSFLTQLQ